MGADRNTANLLDRIINDSIQRFRSTTEDPAGGVYGGMQAILDTANELGTASEVLSRIRKETKLDPKDYLAGRIAFEDWDFDPEVVDILCLVSREIQIRRISRDGPQKAYWKAPK